MSAYVECLRAFGALNKRMHDIAINKNLTKMELKDYKIPPECSRISIRAEGRSLIILFEPDTPNSFFCPETERVEEEPKIGELAIMWDNRHGEAIISRVEDIDYSNFTYKAKNSVWYRHAVRFRDEEQYNKILQSDDAKRPEIKK